MTALAGLELLQHPFRLENILQRIVEVTEQLLPATGGASIILWDSQKKEFYASASTVPNQRRDIAAKRVRRRGGATRWIVDHGQPVIVPDTCKDPFGANPMLQEYRLKAYAGMPISCEGQVVGALYALDRHKRQYSADDIHFLTILAGRAGNAIAYARLLARVEQLAKEDALTGIYNRRAFFEQAQIEFVRARRHDRALSLMVIDLDHFKDINDARGHAAGDLVLQEIARRLQAASRREDFLARYGGDEFVLLLPETNLQNARRLAERLRKQIEENPVRQDEMTIHVTTSIGVATLQTNDQSVLKLLQRADAAMYRAKQTGRNCVGV